MPSEASASPGRTGPDPFVKHRPDAPEGFLAAEAAGLAWLAEAVPDGGAAVVEVLGVDRHEIRLRRLHPVAPTPAAAAEFGRALAVTHRRGAAAFGCAAPDSRGRGWIGPLPLPLDRGPLDRGWGPFFAADRLAPFLDLARRRGAVDADGERTVRAVCERLEAGDESLTGPAEPVARLHGDLWSGNVVWTSSGAVLIDPSAHGGHRESDLAMLALFWAPHLETVLGAYQEAWPLAEGWRRRVGLHQLYPLLVHAALFGAGYGEEAVILAGRYAPRRGRNSGPSGE